LLLCSCLLLLSLRRLLLRLLLRLLVVGTALQERSRDQPRNRGAERPSETAGAWELDLGGLCVLALARPLGLLFRRMLTGGHHARSGLDGPPLHSDPKRNTGLPQALSTAQRRFMASAATSVDGEGATTTRTIAMLRRNSNQ